MTEPTVIEQLAYILIAAGAFIFIISFLGYCGAIKESRVLLTAYGLFIIIIILLQVALIVVAAIYKAEAENHSKKFLQHTIKEHYTHKSQRNAVTLLWDFDLFLSYLRYITHTGFKLVSPSNKHKLAHFMPISRGNVDATLPCSMFHLILFIATERIVAFVTKKLNH